MQHKNIYKAAVQLTRELIKIPSESSEQTSTNGPPETGITSFLSKICLENEISFTLQKVFPDRHNLIIHLPQKGAPKVLFLAHMDTVSGKGMERPFRADYTGGIIAGRGACDDKGPLASLFATLLEMKKNGRKQNFDTTLVCTVDEENTMSGAAVFSKETSQIYDLCLALEPSLLQPISKHKGAYRCRIFPRVSGGPREFSQSDESAKKRKEIIKDIMKDLSSFKKQTEELFDSKLGQACVTLTEIEEADSSNKSPVPQRILVDIRMLPCQTPVQMHREISRIIGKRGKVIPLFAGNGIDSDPADHIIKKFQETLKRQNLSDHLVAGLFPSDCSQMRGQRTCLVWGPGNPKDAHTNEECIEVSQIEGACSVLIDFLYSS